MAPEVDSNVVALPGVKTTPGVSCATVRDATASSWNESFDNIQCYERFGRCTVESDCGQDPQRRAGENAGGYRHELPGVYTGKSVNEPGVAMGGYQNAAGWPTEELLEEI